MASKGLKYIHVKGSGETRVFYRKKLLKAREDIFRLISASPVLKGELGISEYGAGALYDFMRNRRMMATENFRKTQFTRAGEMNAWHYKQEYGSGKTGCDRCHVLCKKKSRTSEPIPKSVKRFDLPMYDPRGAYGMALAYATSTRGGCHLRAYPVLHEILRKPAATGRFSFSGKARIIKLAEDMNAIIDSLTACNFIFFTTTLEEYSATLSAVTGMDFTGQDLLNAGEIIFYSEPIMNSLNGFTSEHDDLSGRFFSSGGSSGSGINIPAIDRGEFLETMRKYYIVRGLSPDGLLTVQTGMVDSFFGNISRRCGNIIYISQTGDSLDELSGCIDPSPMDNTTTNAITSSSEFSAHKEVCEITDSKAILHGHPKYSVIMSMLCDKTGCENRGKCHVKCRNERMINDIPVIPGEAGNGPREISSTPPPVMYGRGTIVYGH